MDGQKVPLKRLWVRDVAHGETRLGSYFAFQHSPQFQPKLSQELMPFRFSPELRILARAFVRGTGNRRHASRDASGPILTTDEWLARTFASPRQPAAPSNSSPSRRVSPPDVHPGRSKVALSLDTDDVHDRVTAWMPTVVHGRFLPGHGLEFWGMER